MGNIFKNLDSKFDLNATRNAGALGFFKKRRPLTTTTTRRLAAFGDQFLVQKIKPLVEWKDTVIDCQYYTCSLMVIYTPVCIYNHDEFFCNIYARKLIVEVPNCLILC